ncbi:MAG: hypothetical protein IPM94_16105 [bacterium]|nr:hypothetical protein [bacterium]
MHSSANCVLPATVTDLSFVDAAATRHNQELDCTGPILAPRHGLSGMATDLNVAVDTADPAANHPLLRLVIGAEVQIAVRVATFGPDGSVVPAVLEIPELASSELCTTAKPVDEVGAKVKQVTKIG